jgi:hypothetical protein
MVEYSGDWKDIPLIDVVEEDNYLQNYAALNIIKEEINRLLQVYAAATGLSFASLIITPLSTLGMGALVSAGISFEYFRRITRLHDTIKMLLDSFGDDGIKITPRVKTDSATIDLFIRMPDKRMFALIIRSSENNAVRWREDTQQFYVKKKGKNEKKSDPLTRVIDELQTIFDLRKKKSPLMGITSSERSAPLIKVIVLAPGAAIASNNSPEIRTEFGEAKVLKIQTTSITYVVECNDLVKFLQLPKK